MPLDWMRLRDRHPKWFAFVLVLKRLRTRIGFALAAYCVLEGIYCKEAPFDLDKPNGWVLTGLVVIVAGALLRIAALGQIKKKGGLTTTGVYSLCRHPLYLASILLAYGFCALLDDPANLVVATGYFVTFYPLTIVWEEIRLEDRYGESFRCYRATTPLVLPLGRFRSGAFDVRNAMRKGGGGLLLFVGCALASVEAMHELLVP